MLWHSQAVTSLSQAQVRSLVAAVAGTGLGVAVAGGLLFWRLDPVPTTTWRYEEPAGHGAQPGRLSDGLGT